MKTPEIFKRIERRLRWKRASAKKFSVTLQALYELTLSHQSRQLQSQSPNPLNAYGRKCFSQADEDGITLEILRRIDGLKSGVYAEFGVGNGMENNSLILAALGWKGFWVGGDDLEPGIPQSAGKRFLYLKEWITLENVVSLATTGLRGIDSERPDVVSLDLDGNDYYFAEALLAADMKPKLFIVEYNAKFPPPIEFKIAYDPLHRWQGDDYFGASLASFAKLFTRFGYKLVCCNAHTGSNAFFVDGRYAKHFDDVPADLRSVWMEPRYWIQKHHGHRVSARTVGKILNGE